MDGASGGCTVCFERGWKGILINGTADYADLRRLFLLTIIG
jgi:hypothetical protein